MPNRTEILHFRATPEEKETIRENAGHAEVALSEWMRRRSLDRRAIKRELEGAHPDRVFFDEEPATQPAVWGCCGASKASGKHAWNCPLIVEQDASADLHETYEQFMERRVPELCGENPSVAETGDAENAARVEWAERR